MWAFLSPVECRGWEPWVSQKLRRYQASHTQLEYATLTSPTCCHPSASPIPLGNGDFGGLGGRSFRGCGNKKRYSPAGTESHTADSAGFLTFLPCFNLHRGSPSTSPPGQCPSTPWNSACPKPKFIIIPNLALFLSVSFLSLPGCWCPVWWTELFSKDRLCVRHREPR